MSWRRQVAKLRGWRSREQRERELEEEIRTHLEMEAEENRAAGLPPDEARFAARRTFGNATLAVENSREGWNFIWLDTLMRDVLYAMRMLRTSPGFAVVAVLTLALGIGASAAIFSVIDAVLLRPLPYPNPQQIVRVWERMPDGHRTMLGDPNFDDFRAQNTTFAYLAEFTNPVTTSISGGSAPARVDVIQVSNDFFKALGVEPLRGRLFAPEELHVNGAPAVIVSYSYWQLYLGGSSDLSKFHLKFTGGAFPGVYPVIGVMPASFDFPPGTAAWIARERYPEIPSRTAHDFWALGRLRDGVTLAQARANLSAIAHRIKAQYGKDVNLSDAAVVPLADAMVGDVRTALLNLLGAVGLLLLVACANVAGLLVARTSARRKELAVRAALGAGRRRLIQQFFAESFVLSLTGGILGALVATWAVKVLPAILPADLPCQHGIAMNTPVLLFALAAIVAIAFALAFFGAWRAGSGDLQQALSAGSRAYTGGGAGQGLRSYVVVGEIATTLVILIGAGLLGRSFLRLVSISPGFNQENLITMEFTLPTTYWAEATSASLVARQVQLTDDIVTRLRRLPGAKGVGIAGAIPVAQGDDLVDGEFLILNGHRPPADFNEWRQMDKDPSMVGYGEYCVASAGYFHTLGIPLIRGRMFGDQDQANTPHVALISQSLARERWPNQDPIGQIIDYGNVDGNLKPLTIVGIVADIRAAGLDRPPSAIVYVDYRQRGMTANTSPTIFVRSAVPGKIVAAARGIFHAVVPDTPVQISTFAQQMGGWLADRRFLLLLVGLFAAAALVLAAVGIYGVVAFSVARRTQEIGVRMAVGAQRSNILQMVLGQGARMATVGVVIGVGASLAITRLMVSLLFGISATDPLTFAGVTALLCLVALLASYIPARRAMGVDPVVALRYE